MFRARASGFFVGFGVAGVLAAYQIRQDILKSHEVLLKQANEYRQGLEKRVMTLEGAVGQLKEVAADAVASAEAAAAAASAAAAVASAEAAAAAASAAAAAVAPPPAPPSSQD